MRLLLNEQDVMDAVAVWIAIKDNDNVVDGSAPEDVQNIELTYDEGNFYARGKIYGNLWRLSNAELINAVAVYLRCYHSFDEDRLRVKVTFDANPFVRPNGQQADEFGADVVVV